MLIGALPLTALAAKPDRSASSLPSAGISKALTTDFPIAFVYGGKPSKDLLPTWKQSHSNKAPDDGKTLHVTTYRDPATGLKVTREITSFSGVAAVECMVRIRNTGARDTPILQNIMPLELQFIAPEPGKLLVHYARGSMGTVEDYLPVDKDLVSGDEIKLSHYVLKGDSHVGGYLPFFNLEWSGGGLIGAVGWTGQWAVEVNRQPGNEVLLRAGQQNTHLTLHPGESIRTPRILLLQWEGNDRLVGHNQLRKLLIAHYVPHINGQPVIPPLGSSNAFQYEYEAIAKKTGKNPLEVVSHLQPEDDKNLAGLADAALNWVNETNQLDFIEGMPPVGIELYWLDAGWFQGQWPFGVGTWDPDATKFPHGLKPLGDAAHKKGLKFLLWFEPGRVGPRSAIASQHPEWVLHQPKEGELGGLFNFGDPAALSWMAESLSKRIDTWGIDIYRQDSNICPLQFWLATDAADRQGVTEIHWVEGLYELWDRLLHQHPGLMIDNANWRITGPDIEVMSRSVGSLTRSETECGGIPHPAATQVQTEELSLWVPLSEDAINGFDPYTFRSGATNGVGTGLDLRSPYVPLEQVRVGIAELKSLRPFWLGDYYPLTEISLDETAWAGWEFYRPDLKAGFAVFFRRSQSTQSTLETSLHGLDPKKEYRVTFAKTYQSEEQSMMTGEKLMHLHVEIGTNPGSLLIKFQQADTPAH